MRYESDFVSFTFIEKCKEHGVQLIRYSWGNQCPMCVNRDYLFWEGTTEPFIHKDCVSPSTFESINDFVFKMKSYAQLQPRKTIPTRNKEIDEFARLIDNTVTLHHYNDVYRQLPREGYLLLNKKSGKIKVRITIEKDPNDVKRSFV